MVAGADRTAAVVLPGAADGVATRADGGVAGDRYGVTSEEAAVRAGLSRGRQDRARSAKEAAPFGRYASSGTVARGLARDPA